MAKRRLLPDWYAAVLVLALLYSGGIAVFYLRGASGVAVNNAKAIDFGREHDYQLFRIDDRRAFVVDGSGDPSVVLYFRENPLVYPCGCFVRGKPLVSRVQYLAGDVAYSKTGGVDLKTGETLGPPVLAARGLSFDAAAALDAERIARAFPPLFTNKSSCNTLLIAGYGILVLLLLMAPFAIRAQRRKNVA
jgi:hypothetical protein